MKLLSKKKISELAVEYFRLMHVGKEMAWRNLYSEIDGLYHELDEQYEEISFKPNYYDELEQIFYAVCDVICELDEKKS